jgi:ring-1,2-phenylacetyl-CoA epoxidase subunit PaaC
MTPQQTEALKDLLYRLADDALILGHRNSEWTGIGPVLEEDIAFSSMAQDEIGYAQAYYELLHELGEAEPDQIAFNRKPTEFRSCQFVEWPIEDYAFSLVRHFLYDYAQASRIQALTASAWQPLALLAVKILREQKYHVLHARTWVTQLSRGSDEAGLRLQTALNLALPMAYGLFEPTIHTPVLVSAGIQPDERLLQERWLELIEPVIDQAGLHMPTITDPTAYYGGRSGYHSDYLEPMLTEMTEVFRIDPLAKW